MIYHSDSVIKTGKIAANFVKRLQKFKTKNAIIIALEGELGAGKTVFVKAIAKALGVKEKIKSPTFVLMKKYQLKLTGLLAYRLTSLYHLDCYRLRDENDLIGLGIEGILKESHNIVCIEWSDRVQKIFPKKYVKIHIDHIDKKTRKISIS